MIKIKELQGTQFEIKMEIDDNIDDIKEKLAEEAGI